MRRVVAEQLVAERAGERGREWRGDGGGAGAKGEGEGREKEKEKKNAAHPWGLEDLLPRRRSKRAATAEMAEGESEGEDERGRGKKAARGTSATRGSGRGRGRGRGGQSKSEGKGRKKQKESTDEVLRGRRERELQERIEYLEDYELQEESVYVI